MTVRSVPASELVLTRVSAARYPALVIAVLIGVGVLLARASVGSASDWLVAGGLVWCAALALLILVRGSSAWFVTPAIALVCITLGGVRYAAVTSGRPTPAIVDLAAGNRPAELFGEVAGSPQKRLSGWRVPVKLTSVRTRTGAAPLQSTVLLTTRQPLDSLHYGDLIRLAARVVLPHTRRNPGGFDYAEHLYNQGIDALIRPAGEIVRREYPVSGLSVHRAVEPIRDWLRDVFSRHLPKVPRTLILGFLIGEIGELPPSILDSVRDAGALHLLAVSGANVWLVVGMVLLPMRLLGVPRWPRSIIILCVVIAFSFLARNEPSVVRASLMIGALLIGSLLRRPIRALNAVGIAAVIILIHSPAHLFQPGFQLSFAAVISIILIVGALSQWSRQPRTRWGRWLLVLCASTVAATVATAPIIAWHFHEVPIVTLPANLLLVPLASVCVYLSIGVLVLDLIWSALAAALSIPLSWLLNLFLMIAGLFSSLPVAVLRWPSPSLISVATLYGLLLAALNWRHRYRFLRPTVYVGGGLIVASIILSYSSGSPPSHQLALLDAGKAHVAVLHSRATGEVHLMTDNPHVTYDLREWVIDPYLRTQGLSSRQPLVEAWLTSPTGESRSIATKALDMKTGHHVRFLSELPEVDGRDRIWADRFEIAGHTVTFIRAAPTDTTTTGWSGLMAAASDVLIVPAQTPPVILRRLLNSTSAEQVVIYGNDIPHRHPQQWFDDLRAHFPDLTLWTTTIHGGITVAWRPDGLRISPTIANSSWHDRSGR